MEIFIDDSAIDKVEELKKKYKETWGKEVDFTLLPALKKRIIITFLLQISL